MGSKKEKEALKIAIEAIYFNDNSDYLTALWDIVKCLDTKMCDLAMKNISKAFKKTHPECRED